MEKQSRIIAKAIAISVFLVVIYLLLPTIVGFIENPPGAAYISYPESVKFEFEQDISISARTFTINVTIPTSNQFQKVNVVQVSNYPVSVHHSYNRTWWSFSAAGTENIVIRYSGETITKYWDIKNSGSVSDIPIYLKNRYLHSEYIKGMDGTKRYVITPNAFKNVTEKITAGQTTVVGKLRSIYDYIVQHFHYETERNGNPKTAIQTWNTQSGDCDELSFVFVSMARSIGIPAWVEYGWLYTEHTWGQHAWIQTAIPYEGNIEYVNIDLTVEVGRQDLGRGFLIRDPFRITEWVDDGNSEHLSAFYHYVYYTEPPQLQLSQSINVVSMKEFGSINIPVGETISSWLMALIFGAIIVAVIAIIIKI